MLDLGKCKCSKPYVRKVVGHFGLRACSGIKTFVSNPYVRKVVGHSGLEASFVVKTFIHIFICRRSSVRVD